MCGVQYGNREGKLCIVDMAGMESSKKSAAIDPNPARKEEAKHINISLVSLGTVIDKLGHKGGHIPWRDSKLARMLQEGLTGGGTTAILVTLRLENENIEEAIATLRFAAKAKAVKVHSSH